MAEEDLSGGGEVLSGIIEMQENKWSDNNKLKSPAEDYSGDSVECETCSTGECNGALVLWWEPRAHATLRIVPDFVCREPRG